MQNRYSKILGTITSAVFAMIVAFTVAAEEIIVQQEKITFEKCLLVITTSENKLSIAPKITDISDQKRIAVFTLADGRLTITCDDKEGMVTVSTDMD